VSLTVVDSNGTSNRTDLKVTVLNRVPVANFTVTSDAVGLPDRVGYYSTVFRFNASGSTDRDGSIVSYIWTFGDGSKVLYQGKVINYTYDRPGNYTVVLAITDNDGSKAQTSKNVTILDLPPVVKFTFTPTGGNVTTTFKFNSTSKDPDGTIVEYNWSFGDGTYSHEVAPEHRYLDDGTFIVSLEVKDDGGWLIYDKKVIVLQDLPPVAKAAPGTQTIKVGVKANFTASGTTDLDDKLTELTFEWDFADGSAKATGMLVSHVYGTAGEYNVTLKVTDSKGATSTAKVHVTVQAPVIPKPKPKPHDNSGATAGIIALVLIVIVACGIGGFLLMRRKKGGPETETVKKDPEPIEKVEPEATKEAEGPKEEPPADEGPMDEDEGK
jgi:PKD repeat protein